MKTVGVFRDAPIRAVAEAAARLDLDAVQLHGAEDRDYVHTLRRELAGSAEIWASVSVGRDAISDRGADRMLFDHGDGGSGRGFDWRLVAGIGSRPKLIAGGIGSHNAVAAARLGAFAIDIGRASMRSRREVAVQIRGLFEELRLAGGEGLAQCA